MSDFMQQAQALREELIARRRDLHQHPELAFEEVRTAGIVAEELNRLGLEVQTGVGTTGVVGVLEGAQDGPTVLYRADMDALPIEEENQVEYASTVPGKMHACGHDGHTAIGLGVARLLSEQRDRLAGRVKFVFQPAEEIVEGARAMIADGVLHDPRPDVSLGLHLWNTMPVGVVGISEGPIMAGSSTFEMQINGRGGHAAMPQAAIDPVVCAAHIILALQTIVARNANPLESAVMSVTMMKGSDADNIIPERAMLGGTFRTYSMEMRDLVEARLRQISESVAAAMGCSVDISVKHGTIPTVNDAAVTARMVNLFAPIVGRDNLITEARTMGSEDMAYFMDDIPGLYCFVGSANSARGLDFAHHHPRFDFDEDVLTLGVGLMTTAIAEYLLPR